MQTQRRNEQLMKEIQDTLQRIKDGNFGICQACGGDIEVDHLRVQPTATLCITCRRELKMLPRIKIA